MHGIGARGMEEEGTTLDGEAAALIRAGAAGAATTASSPQWLLDLKATAEDLRHRCERPLGKPFGRWLGDFLDQDSASGLLPAEERLLFAAVNGEACVLESRASILCAALEEWRDHMPEAPPQGEMGFVEAMAKFTEAAPEPVQEAIIEATRHAIDKLRLPAYWEPRDAHDVEKFALAQRAFLTRLESDANPVRTVEHARKDERFYHLAAETLIASSAPKPYEPLKLHHEWLNPLLRRDPLDLSVDMRAKIDAQPRVLHGFFDELSREVKGAGGAEQDFAGKLKADPSALGEPFDTVFARYEREHWRWVDPEDPDVQIRARFLRFLSLGGDDFAPVHESRLELHGAYIGEDLDLSGCTIRQPLLFSRCHFAGKVLLQNAATKSLNFQRSRVLALIADSSNVSGGVFCHSGFRSDRGFSFLYASIEGGLRLTGGTVRSDSNPAMNCAGARVAGDVLMNDGFLGEGGVFFSGAKIGGIMRCDAGTFRNRKEDGSAIALGCDGNAISGDAVLANGFHSEGLVSFAGASIGGALDCHKGTFLNRTRDGTGVALNGADAEVESVSLRDGFRAEGKVDFHASRVRGNLLCVDGRFDNASPKKADGSSKWIKQAADAIDLQGAKVDGILWLGPDGRDASAKAEIRGSVNLAGCHAHEIVDHSKSWPKKRVRSDKGKRLPTFIHLDGFTYDRLAGGGDYDRPTRRKWLDRQPPKDRGLNFRPQPFEQLIKVYREMGHERSAREIAKLKARRYYRSLFIRIWHGWRDVPKIVKSRLLAPLNYIAWPFAIVARVLYGAIASIFLFAIWAFVGFGTAYWYGWGRLTLFLLALWGAGGLFYREVALQGSFSPSNPVIYLNKDLEAKCGKNWTQCKGAPPELPSFNPFIYSLDIMLPVLDLGQKRDWQPIDRPDKPVRMVFPTLIWEPGYDLGSDIPDLIIEEEPLAEGTVDRIVRVQTLLSWATLGLLIAMLSGLIKKD